MQTDFHLEKFNGPLDLLLNLVGEQKLDISEISLTQVTEQYLNYLNAVEEKMPEDLADFLVIAARLLFLKSKNLLPEQPLEEDEGPSLADQLRLYQAFVEASKKLNHRWNSGKRGVFRIVDPYELAGFVPPPNLGLEKMREFMVKLLDRIKPLPSLPQTSIDKGVSLKEKAEQIKNLFQSIKFMSFQKLLNDAKSRTEVIVTFLALLELMKKDFIALKQKKVFEEILIERI